MTTTLPKEVMEFKDFPFPAGEESFVSHQKVLQYLKDYAKHFNLSDHIKFHHKVKSVTPVKGNSGEKWHVIVEDMVTKTHKDYIFDAVMIGSGHYSTPNIPELPGIELFKGTAIHSHQFRKRDGYEGKDVVIWGASSSGLDIALELCRVAKSVTISHRPMPKIHSELPKNVKEAENLVSATEDGFEFADGTTCKADALLFCTGYRYTFPYLSKECGIQVDDNRITPLYMHLINIEHPTMCFLGVPVLMLPFIMSDYQVQFFLKSLDGSISLPTKEEMLMSSEKDFQRRLRLNMPNRHAHRLDWLQWEYYDDLATYGKLEKLNPIIRKIYEHLRVARRDEVMHYKSYQYKIQGDGNFTVIKNTCCY
ncbi:hypothetical protein J437_LFUL005201 [Ladona fulva]|uniref:Flavin-containing monooxygenase n=1 Tax=Ladona fulva TaxID=123851 RepID=A0A8K0JXP7_LADFU|nr:hypothetical protein J437_LFUL005201 [Ladona fulva]